MPKVPWSFDEEQLNRLHEVERNVYSSFRVWSHKMLNSPYFDTMIAVVIVVNAVVMAIEVDSGARRRSEPVPHYQSMMKTFSIMEWFFILVYTAELALRAFVYRLDALRNHWVKFDAILVLLAWLEVAGKVLSYFAFPIAPGIFRICRLGKLLRTFRLVAQCRPLWKLLQGMTQSFETLCYAFGMIMVLLTVFACFALELIAKDDLREVDAAFDAHVEFYFSSLGVAIVSLSTFVLHDSCFLIYHEIVSKNPYLSIYFIALVLVLAISMMDMIAAVLVDSALDNSQQHKDMAKAMRCETLRDQLPDIEEFFKELDADGSGHVTRAEMMMMPYDITIELMAITGGDDIGEIFEYLDMDDNGFVDIDELASALEGLITSRISIDTRRIMKALSRNRRDIQDVEELCRLLVDKIQA